MKQFNYRIMHKERLLGYGEPEVVTGFSKHEAYKTLIQHVLDSGEENIILMLTHRNSAIPGPTDGIIDCDDFTVTWIPIEQVNTEMLLNLLDTGGDVLGNKDNGI